MNEDAEMLNTDEEPKRAPKELTAQQCANRPFLPMLSGHDPLRVAGYGKYVWQKDDAYAWLVFRT